MSIFIKPGGRLLLDNYDDSYSDVTPISIKYLFDRCTIEEGVTLRDIFKVLNENLEYYDAIVNSDCSYYVKEALSIPINKNFKSETIEYLSLSMFLTQEEYVFADSLMKAVEGNYIDLSGVGHVLESDEWPYKKGDRSMMSVSLNSIESIIDLPIKLNNIVKVSVYKAGVPIPEIELGLDGVTFTFGSIVHGILEELSYHGTSEEKKEFLGQLIVAKNNSIKRRKYDN